MSEWPDVRDGDVWKDNDPRGGPTVLVQYICNSTACPNQPEGEWHAHVTGTDGKRARTILMRRFRPTRSGYVLVSRNGQPVALESSDG